MKVQKIILELSIWALDGLRQKDVEDYFNKDGYEDIFFQVNNWDAEDPFIEVIGVREETEKEKTSRLKKEAKEKAKKQAASLYKRAKTKEQKKLKRETIKARLKEAGAELTDEQIEVLL